MNELSNDYFDTSTNFSGRNAHALGLVSGLAYKSADEAKAGLIALGMKFDKDDHNQDQFRFVSDPNTSTEVIIASDSQKTIVAFRGSQEREDWVTNRIAILESNGIAGKTHYGITQALLAVWSRVTGAITTFGTNKPLWFCGHSLGGALATLAAAYLKLENQVHPHGVYTYGAPRVGNQSFASTYDQHLKRNTFRYVNDLDIVPQLPPESLGYEHVGHLCHFDDTAQLKTEVSLLDELKLAALQWFDREVPDELAKDHSLSEYVVCLRAHADTDIQFK